MALPIINAGDDATELLLERLQERTQDINQAGFQNLGLASNVFSSSLNSNFRINGQGGADTVQLFGIGNDIIRTGSGADFVFAGEGNDVISGGSQNDTLIGYEGNDTISGGSGDDTLEGGFGTDSLTGGSGKDQLFGGAGADIIKGGLGDDELFGDHDGSSTLEQGRDTMSGGSGNDKIHGGGNADVMAGNAGADIFIFDHVNDFVFGHADFISDFSRTEGDRIDLTAVDAVGTLAGNQNFDFVDGPSTVAGTLWLGTSADGRQHVFMNVDGGSADLDILVRFNDATMTSLQESDFLL